MDLTTLNVIITGGISALGAVLSFFGARKGAKIQQINTDKTIKKDLEIARMQLEEKTVTENQINRLEELRVSISDYIETCYQINLCLNSVEGGFFENREEEVQKYKELSTHAIKIISKIKLNIFESSDELGVKLINEIVNSTQYLEKERRFPDSQLNKIENLGITYLDKRWSLINKAK